MGSNVFLVNISSTNSSTLIDFTKILPKYFYWKMDSSLTVALEPIFQAKEYLVIYIYEKNSINNDYKFGFTPQYFGIRYNSTKLLKHFLKQIEDKQKWIEFSSFHMYLPEFNKKWEENPKWDWESIGFEENYEDTLLFDLKTYSEDEKHILPQYPEMIPVPLGSFSFPCYVFKEEVAITKSFSLTKRFLSLAKYEDFCKLLKRSLSYNLYTNKIVFQKPFAISKYPITFAEYDRFCQATGRPFPHDLQGRRDNHPVVQVSWRGAHAYCDWLSQRSGKSYRLPSELEWEYVARWGLSKKKQAEKILPDNEAYYSTIQSVGSYFVNDLGVYDLFSPIWEWTLDYNNNICNNLQLDGSAFQEIDKEEIFEEYHENYIERERIARGGGWLNRSKIYSASVRASFLYLLGYPNVGFRIVEDLTV